MRRIREAYREVWGRLVWLKWVVCLATLVGMATCPSLWLAVRGFPCVPAVPGVPVLPPLVTAALTAVLVAGCLVVAVLPRPGWWPLAPFAAGVLLVLFDIDRLQPWFYEYLAMFAILALVDWRDQEAPRSRAAWGACAAIVAGIYLWSGIQKANMLFAHDIFPFLMQPLGATVAKAAAPLWFVGPIYEASTGILLVVPRTRSLGIGMAVAMHGFLLLVLGPLGHNYNSSVWPWNVAMASMAAILFGGDTRPLIGSAWAAPFGRVALILFGIVPVLHFAGYWDGFLAFSFYSGRLRDGWIYLTRSGEAHLPARYKVGGHSLVEQSPGLFRLDITQWAMVSMNVPPYAEPRAYDALARRLVEEGVPRRDLRLLVRDQSPLGSSDRSYSPRPTP